MKELTKQELLDKLVEIEFITTEQSKGFEKLTNDELSHLLVFLEKNNSAIDENKKTIADLEAQLSDAESKIEVYESDEYKEIVETPEPGLSFSFRGVNYKFKDSAPKNIRFDNQVLSQKDLVKNTDYVLELVAGNSSLIQKV